MGKPVRIYTLCSGSSGNCTYVRCGDTEFLIDAGASRRAIAKALESLGTSLSRIAAILVTHEHSDHVKGLPMIAKYDRIPIYIHPRSAKALSDIDASLLHMVEHPAVFFLGEVEIASFVTPHDSLSSCGYVMKYQNARYGYATDMGIPVTAATDALCGCEAVILEANYDKTMLKTGPYPYFLKQRIASNEGHLDNEVTAKFCSFLGKTGTKKVLLAHLSAENNTPEKAKAAVAKKLKEDAVTLEVDVAGRYEPSELIVRNE